jgi:hypothetical protein
LAAWKRALIWVAAPFVIALAVIELEGWLANAAIARPGILPVVMVALVAGMLMPTARRWLIVTLCFGIGLLAFRDTFRIVPIPAEIDYVIVEQLYPVGWMSLSLLAFGAGIAEALRPGSVWARRCYFAAAFVYFTGHGLISFLKFHQWQSLVMLATGAIAVFGIATAKRVIASEDDTTEEADIKALAEQNARRSARIADREWRESHEPVSSPQ